MFRDYYIGVLKKYAVFSGRARRKEFWFFVLFSSIISILLGILLVLVSQFVIGGNTDSLVFFQLGYSVYSVFVFIPTIAVTVRRLHDVNRSGFFWLLCLIPYVGAIILLVFLVKNSTPGANKYGQNPKGKSEQERERDEILRKQREEEEALRKQKEEEQWQEDVRTGKVDFAKAEVSYNLGATLANDGKNDEALEQFAKAIEFNPRHKDAYNGRIIVHFRMENWDAVIADCKMALKLGEDDYNYRHKIEHFLGSAYFEKKDYENTVYVLSGFHGDVQVCLALGISHNNLAVNEVASSLKRIHLMQAKDAFEEALNLDPTNSEARRLFDMVPAYKKYY